MRSIGLPIIVVASLVVAIVSGTVTQAADERLEEALAALEAGDTLLAIYHLDRADLEAAGDPHWFMLHGRLLRSRGSIVDRLNSQYVLERAVLLCSGRVLGLDHLPPRLKDGADEASAEGGIRPLAQVEEEALRRALALGLTQEETARRLGIDPATLWRKRKKLGL